METTRIVPGATSGTAILKPDLIDGIILDRQVGSGATARVYLAYDVADPSMRYAVKFLSAFLSYQEDALRRWKRESELLKRLDHPNIVKGIRYGFAAERPYLVMEYLQGETLADRMRREERLPEEEVLHIAHSCLAALDAAHRNGIVHRDVKPANIIRLNDGTIKLTDFGLAHDEADESLTVTGAIIGTPVYLSPEQAMGGEVGIRSDLYSLGVTLFHLATGRPPYKELNTSLLLTRKITDDIPDVRLFEPSIGGNLAFFIHELCHRSPTARPETPAAAIKLLRQLEDGLLTTSGFEPVQKPDGPRLRHMERSEINSEDLVLRTVVGDDSINSRPCFLNSGEVLFYEDDTSLECYILMSGKVEILKNGRPIAVINHEGAFIGEMSPLRKAPRSATVVAREDSVLLMVPEAEFEAFLKRHPELMLVLARSLAERLENTNKQLSQASQKIGLLTRHVQDMAALVNNQDK